MKRKRYSNNSEDFIYEKETFNIFGFNEKKCSVSNCKSLEVKKIKIFYNYIVTICFLDHESYYCCICSEKYSYKKKKKFNDHIKQHEKIISNILKENNIKNLNEFFSKKFKETNIFRYDFFSVFDNNFIEISQKSIIEENETILNNNNVNNSKNFYFECKKIDSNLEYDLNDLNLNEKMLFLEIKKNCIVKNLEEYENNENFIILKNEDYDKQNEKGDFSPFKNEYFFKKSLLFLENPLISQNYINKDLKICKDQTLLLSDSSNFKTLFNGLPKNYEEINETIKSIKMDLPKVTKNENNFSYPFYSIIYYIKNLFQNVQALKNIQFQPNIKNLIDNPINNEYCNNIYNENIKKNILTLFIEVWKDGFILYDFIEKEFKIIILSCLNIPYELIKNINYNHLSSLHFLDSDYDQTKNLIEDLNIYEKKIFIIYHKIINDYILVKIKFIIFCADYDQILNEVNMKKANCKNFCIKDKINKLQIIEDVENEKRNLKELFIEYENFLNSWKENKKKSISIKTDYKFYSKLKMDSNYFKHEDDYFMEKNFYYKLKKITPWVLKEEFDIFKDTCLDFSHGLLNCIFKQVILFIFIKISEENVKEIEKKFLEINESIKKNVPEINCLIQKNFNFQDYNFDDWKTLVYITPYIFKETFYYTFLEDLSIIISLGLRKIYKKSTILKIKEKYKKLLSDSKEFFSDRKKDNVMKQHSYSHLVKHVFESMEKFGPACFWDTKIREKMIKKIKKNINKLRQSKKICVESMNQIMLIKSIKYKQNKNIENNNNFKYLKGNIYFNIVENVSFKICEENYKLYKNFYTINNLKNENENEKNFFEISKILLSNIVFFKNELIQFVKNEKKKFGKIEKILLDKNDIILVFIYGVKIFEKKKSFGKFVVKKKLKIISPLTIFGHCLFLNDTIFYNCCYLLAANNFFRKRFEI
jgi:hypothetical protein